MLAVAEVAEVVQAFRGDLNLYSHHALRIQTKAGEDTPFDFNRAQRTVDAKVAEQLATLGCIRAIVLKARQEGISTYVAARVYRGCSLWSNRNALVLGDSDDRAGILYRIYERFDLNVPAEVRPRKKASRRGQELLFAHDSQISVATAGGRNPGRAMTRFYLHLSELAFWEHQIEVLTGVLQTVLDGIGEVWIESTANGVGDEFHERWQQAEAGESDYIAIFLPWWIHEEYSLPGITHLDALSDWERMALEEGIEWEGQRWKLTVPQLAWRRTKIANEFGGDARIFRQEYPATAREAFLVSGNAYFDDEALVEMEAAATAPVARANIANDDAGAPILLRPAERGYVRIWEMPDPLGHYVIGADTAEGRLAAARDASLSDAEAERGGRDFNSADVLKVATWVWDAEEERWELVPCERQVAQIHGRMDPDVFAEQLYGVGMAWSCKVDPTSREDRVPALIAVERNHSSGQTTLRHLRDLRYPRLFWRRHINQRTNKPTTDVGWVTDGASRMLMLDELARDVRRGDISVPSPDTVREMYTFVRGDDGRPEAQEGTHDDRVISLAIARQMIRHHRHGDPLSAPDEPKRKPTPTGV